MCTVRLAAFLLALPAAAFGQRTLTIERFDAEAIVLERGTTVVTERIRARFDGQWNGLYRSIPINYRNDAGLNYKLILDIERVTDDAGAALRYETENVNGHRKIKMWVPGAHDATRTVVLRYRVANLLRFFDEHDELYWNVTGLDWDVPIRSASARILLPAQASNLRAAAYTGAYGSRADASRLAITGNAIEIAVDSLKFREGLTVVAGWSPGVIARPSAAAKAAHVGRSNIVLLLPLLALLLMWKLWNRYGRDPRRLSIAPAYEPPADMTPAEAGTLTDNNPDPHDITATIVDLAVRGFLTIEERKEEALFGLISDTSYTFRKTRDRKEWAALQKHEQYILAALFADGDTVEDSDLKNKFYKSLNLIRESLLDRLVERGYYKKRPDVVKTIWVLTGIASTVAILFLGFYLNDRAGIDSPAPIIAAALTGVIMIGFGLFMPTRTVFGVRTLEHVLGFEDFLNRVESDRFERVIKTPELFEKYLPYAMALKVDSNWCRAFEGIYSTPPSWYQGSHINNFSPVSFNSSLNRMATSTAAVMASAPRSSSGSSGFSSGGGFSGGGFGGGGGGGF